MDAYYTRDISFQNFVVKSYGCVLYIDAYYTRDFSFPNFLVKSYGYV